MACVHCSLRIRTGGGEGGGQISSKAAGQAVHAWEVDEPPPPSPPPAALQGSSFMSKEPTLYDLGEFIDQTLSLYLDGDHSAAQEDQRQTLNIFPSRPMHVEPSAKNPISLAPEATSERPSKQSMTFQQAPRDHPSAMASSNTKKDIKSTPVVKIDQADKKIGISSSDHHRGPKSDAKTLRRLAQNREAARKSRLRKKAYIQQLESSRIKLSQLEQELSRTRTQGADMLGFPNSVSGLGPDAALFDMEYGRWVEEHHRLMFELRAAMQEQMPESQLRVFVDSALAHYDALMNLKSIMCKSDVFYIVSGMWKTPAERCFMWIGGFRPSDLIKVVAKQIETLNEQQVLGVCELQQSTQETEEALSQGLQALHKSLLDTMTSDMLSSSSNNMVNYMGQMAVAVGKLSALEGFVRQSDNFRMQTLHRIRQILTTQQAGLCFLAMAEHFHRLRALSSLWLSRPKQERTA